MSWPWSKPAPSAEQEAARVAAENAAQLEELQTRHDTNATLIGQYGANVKRFDDKSNEATSPADREKYKAACARAFKTMRMMQKQQETLGGQIDTLMGITTNVQSMSTNVKLHGRIKDSNAVTARIAGTLDADEVSDTMAEVGEHQQQHDEISDTLAGRFMGTTVDPDEEADDLASFLGHSTATVSSAAVTAPMSNEARDRARLEAEEEALQQLLATMPKPAARQAAAVTRGK